MEDRKTLIYNLLVELAETEKNKKATVKEYNEEIKRIKSEIEELLELEEDKDKE